MLKIGEGGKHSGHFSVFRFIVELFTLSSSCSNTDRKMTQVKTSFTKKDGDSFGHLTPDAFEVEKR